MTDATSTDPNPEQPDSYDPTSTAGVPEHARERYRAEHDQSP